MILNDKIREFNIKSFSEDNIHDEKLIKIENILRNNEKEFDRSKKFIESILLNQEALSFKFDKLLKPKQLILNLEDGFFDITKYMKSLILIIRQKW